MQQGIKFRDEVDSKVNVKKMLSRRDELSKLMCE